MEVFIPMTAYLFQVAAAKEIAEENDKKVDTGYIHIPYYSLLCCPGGGGGQEEHVGGAPAGQGGGQGWQERREDPEWVIQHSVNIQIGAVHE